MARWKKKPVEVDAWPVRTLVDDWHRGIDLPPSVDSAVLKHTLRMCEETIVVRTLEGNMVGAADDILIRGVKGEFYPCKPDVFFATYDEVHAA